MTLRPIDPNTTIFTPAFEYQAKTMQVPCGDASILSQLEAGLICAFEAMIYLDLNMNSTWANGETSWISASELSRIYKMSLRWVRDILSKGLETWATRLNLGPKGKRYHLKHHVCPQEETPLDKYGDPKRFAVAYGEGGPFDRLYKGEISWRACLIWIVLKYYSEWDPKKKNCAQTDPMTMDTLRRRVRMKKQHVCEAIKELQNAGMLKRLSKPWEISVFQLYPKPRPKGHAEHAREKYERSKGRPGTTQDEPHSDGTYVYSYNNLVRCRIKDLKFETRKKKDEKWTPTDPEKVLRRKGGPRIVKDLEDWCLKFLEAQRSFRFSSDTASVSSDTAGGQFRYRAPLKKRGR